MQPRRESVSNSLLSPRINDDDESSLRSLSDQDSDSEDDEFIQANHSSLELAKHDRQVLEDEEEMEKLLTRSGPADGLRRIFSAGNEKFDQRSVRIGKRERRRRRRRERQASQRDREGKADEEGILLHEMEEGGFNDDTSSLSSTPSSELDRAELDSYNQSKASPQTPGRFPEDHVFAGIIVLFAIFVLGAYKASSGFRASHRTHNNKFLSNGTSLFAPTTILISLDGFRADFLNRGLTPTLNSFIAEGISPKYMLPSFPSVTFPNHFTLVTGLYPESHGVVGNTFWDPELEEDFYYTDPERSLQPKWWNAEPIWVTAENQGVRTAIHMWPGSEAHIGDVEPSFVDKFNGSEVLSRKVDRILQFLDLPGQNDTNPSGSAIRPQLIAAYVPDVDADGHTYGPNSTEIRDTISSADQMIEDLFRGLQDRNLTDVVNVVVVSDHGMATTSTERLVQLEDLVDLSLVDRLDGWPLRGLRPKDPADIPVLEEQLRESSKDYTESVEFYTRETMPERYHFSNNDRIAPLWVIPKTGWAIVERPDFDVEEALASGEVYHPRGVHGYDHEHPLMRAIFVAHGPSFIHKPNSRVEVFQNTEVYNILCDSIGVEPHNNNGTLRLPLKPVGLHSDDSEPLETPPDPVTTGKPSSGDTEGSSSTDGSEGEEKDQSNTESSSWFGVLANKFESAKQWFKGLFHNNKDGRSNLHAIVRYFR
ncbi:hypothetical protein FQN54_009215 [Arachnomyces sp. PD_36]|nr:hypothetical protein FQN54_009215 [Arachnomyces sp. PD_36]